MEASSNGHNKLTDAGANLIRHFEGCHRKIGEDRYAAFPGPGGILSIGYGHTNASGREIVAGEVWSLTKCNEVFAEDMKRYEDTVKRLVKVPLSPCQFDAMVSFAFNVTESNLIGSELLRMVNTADWVGAAQEFNRWNKSGGYELSGLTRRRATEALLFQNIPDKHYDEKAVLAIQAINDMAHSVENPDRDNVVQPTMGWLPT